MIMVFTSSAVPQILTAGIVSAGIPAATNDKVSFRLNGSSGDLNCVIIF